MAGVQKVNPHVATENWQVVGKELTVIAITATAIPDEAAGAADQPGWEADGALNALYATLQTMGTIVISGPLVSGVFTVIFEGVFDAAQVALLDADCKALASIAGTKLDGTANTPVDLSSTALAITTL